MEAKDPVAAVAVLEVIEQAHLQGYRLDKILRLLLVREGLLRVWALLLTGQTDQTRLLSP